MGSPIEIRTSVNRNLIGERTEYCLQLRSTFDKSHIRARNLEIAVPLPATAESVTMEPSSGTCCFMQAAASVVWRISELHGQSELSLAIGFPSHGVSQKDFDPNAFES